MEIEAHHHNQNHQSLDKSFTSNQYLHFIQKSKDSSTTKLQSINQNDSSTPTTPPRHHNSHCRRHFSLRRRLPSRPVLPLRPASLLLTLPLPPLRPRLKHHLSSHGRQTRPSPSPVPSQWSILRHNRLPTRWRSAHASHSFLGLCGCDKRRDCPEIG